MTVCQTLEVVELFANDVKDLEFESQVSNLRVINPNAFLRFDEYGCKTFFVH